MGLKAERFPAIKHAKGMVGCNLSHATVLREAAKRGYQRVLILEDDCEFNVDQPTFQALLEKAFQEVPDFEVIQLAHGIKHAEPFSDLLVRVFSGCNAAA